MRRAFNREELDIRMAVLPFLTAESDVKYAGRAPPRARSASARRLARPRRRHMSPAASELS